MQSISTALVGIVIAMIANWKLACIVLCFLPCVIAQSYAQTRLMRGFGADAKEMYEQASTIATDAISNIRTVASFCAEEKIIESYRKKCEGPVRQGVRQGAISGVGYGFSFALLFCFYAASFYVGACFVHNGTAEVGQVFKVFFALTMMAVGVSQLSSLARDFGKVQNAAASIFRIIDRKSKIDASHEVGTTLCMQVQRVAVFMPSKSICLDEKIHALFVPSVALRIYFSCFVIDIVVQKKGCELYLS